MDPTTETTTTTTAPTTTEPVTAPAEGKTFNQEQVNAIVAQRLAEDRARRTPKVEQAKPAATEKLVEPDLKAELEELKQRSAFDKRAAKFDVPDETAERLFKLYRTENPTDPAAWFESTAKAFGLKGMNTSTQTAPVQEPTKPPSVAPSSSQPNAVTPVTTGGLVDIYIGLTPEQFAAMSPTQIKEHHEKNVAAAQARLGAPPIPKAGPRK